MQFLHISKTRGQYTHQYLKEACEKRDIDYVQLLENEISPIDLLHYKVSEDDIVYKSTRGVWGSTVEKIFLKQGARSAFYDRERAFTGKGSSYDMMDMNNIKVVPSIPFLPTEQTQTDEFADYLGGFPMVIKVSGGMEGVGVIRVDSAESFNSVSDFVKKDTSARVRVMKYIPHRHFARVVVVKDEVVAATIHEAPHGDFRGSARGLRLEKAGVYEPTPELADMSVRATKSIGVKTGGVDLILADSGEIYVAEVNSPFNFAETQKITGIDIAGAIVDACL